MPNKLASTMDDDPLSRALAPPPEETPEERQRRLRDEREAKRISDEIDAQLQKEQRMTEKQNSQVVRVLLLGQSESGKSTTLKNFQMIWAPQAWREERASWRSVVVLNVIKSTFNMLSVLLTPSSSSSMDHFWPQGKCPVNLDGLFSDLTNAESTLKRRLCAFTQKTKADGGEDEPGDYRTGSTSAADLFVPSNVSWKKKFLNVRGSTQISQSVDMKLHPSVSEQKDEAMDIMIARKSDILQLWKSPVVQELLNRRGVILEESSGFFMNDLERILDSSYEPSDDDVMRARLRTVGIQEHKFRFETGVEVGREWVIYDVGGSRPQRASWFSFFENVHAIIFLVPVNCFDEILEEDPNVNRLQDSIGLWKEICSSRLLAKAQLILFLNKVDLLQRKLESGVVFANFAPKFAEHQNDRDTVCRYLRNQFHDIQKRHSPEPRSFNAWLTCATDTKATEKTIATVRHGIIKENFAKAHLV